MTSCSISALRRTVGTLAVSVIIAGPVSQAAEPQVGVAGTLDPKAAEKGFPAQRPYSPYVGSNIPTRVYFGDTHLHTSYSMDAGAFGARLTPRDAYLFARGNEVRSWSGQPVKLSRPLDFLVVGDHSGGMGWNGHRAGSGIKTGFISFVFIAVLSDFQLPFRWLIALLIYSGNRLWRISAISKKQRWSPLTALIEARQRRRRRGTTPILSVAPVAPHIPNTFLISSARDSSETP